jgi:DNA-binding response OmpR family regulator
MFLVVREKTEGNSLFRVLQDAGYELTTTTDQFQAMAMLFVMKSVHAVIVDQRGEEHASFDLPRHLRGLRRDIPIALLSHEPLPQLPDYIDACVSDQEPLETLVHVLDEVADHSRVAA